MKKLMILGLAALMVVAFTVPAMAKTYVGGIIFQDNFYYSADKETTEGGVAKGSSTTEEDYSGFFIKLNHISRFKFRWTNESNVGMYIETYVDDDNSNTGLRQAYGWWDVNPAFRISVGKHFTTSFSPLFPRTFLGLDDAWKIIGIGYGNFYSGRWTAVRFRYKVGDVGAFRIDFSDPHKTTSASFIADDTGDSMDNDSKIPRIDIGFPFSIGSIKLYPSAFYHKSTFDDVAGSSDDDEIVSYGLSLGIKAGFGPLTIQAEINQGENWGNSQGLFAPLVFPQVYGGHGAEMSASMGADIDSNGKVTDAELLGYWIDVSFKAGMATPHLIYGSQSCERDVSGAKTDWDVYMYGLTVDIPMAKGFLVRPEIMFYDNGDDNKVNGTKYDFGKEMVAGVQFLIAF